MTSQHRDIEVVRVVPRSGARDELLQIRPRLIEEYRAHFGDRFTATLSEAEDGEWVDVWTWADRADAEHALEHQDLIPSFAQWEERVELRSLTWARVIA
ncbi:hypothetical protein [Modestobacter sp. VKM Ac-2978]|uniref:hypothetical protein n=1 Tax=Modestobacter sp. VKM Ac-2978 TaxID=3004132 RepID=UPI0022AAE15D|nr:hypothetical protein [Modestobacter sp. VKM Ac-2978]MCZ2849910.1 hypothetical protein [Modestobacter sp. VKM Ac-2978]